MIVVGTAGHIDHGKSSIVKRLTGTDPDRLPEEKARGMTIELGFAFYRTPAGEEIAFVDVPGHERFVRNMIAGAGGIDTVMLVVAADDGWMPQSEEHFAILKLLRVKSGVIVINKSDLAEPDWLELLEQDIRARVKGSFLEGAPLFRISAETGAGFGELSGYLNSLPEQVQHRQETGKARLYIDRSFVQTGIGGVVTGTLRGGTFSLGQGVAVWPARHSAKIRTLQVEGRDVTQVTAGSRTAVSLTGIDKEELVRGGVISDRTDLSFFSEHPVLALTVELLRNAVVPLEDRRRTLLLVGTTEAEGEVRMFDAEAIKPGQSGIAFFRPDDPLYCLVGDRFVLRLPTPAVTLGGGMVLDHLAHFPRRRDLAELEYLRERVSGSVESVIKSELSKRPLARTESFLEDAEIVPSELSSLISGMIKRGEVGRFGTFIYATAQLERSVDLFKERLATTFQDKSHLKGLTLDELLSLSPFDKESTPALIEYLLSQGQLVKLGDKYNLVGRGMSLKGVVKEAHDKLLAQLKAEPYAPPTLPQMAAQGKPYQDAIKYMIDAGECHKCGSELLLWHEVWSEIVAYVRERLGAANSLAVADLKDRFGFSRKYAIPILEETDRLKLTSRQGDVRIKGDRFESEEFIS